MLTTALIIMVGFIGLALFKMWTGGHEAASIGIIGGADGPTAIYVTSKIAPHVVFALHVAAALALCIIIWAIFKRLAK